MLKCEGYCNAFHKSTTQFSKKENMKEQFYNVMIT